MISCIKPLRPLNSMCVFCEIIKGNIPSSKVYEDDRVLAILDLSQTTKGHTLVMPKKHYEDLSAIPSDELMDLMSKVQMIAKHLEKVLNAKGYNILINKGEVAGQTMMHLHVHIIPRYSEDDTIKIEFSENKFDLNSLSKKVKL